MNDFCLKKISKILDFLPSTWIFRRDFNQSNLFKNKLSIGYFEDLNHFNDLIKLFSNFFNANLCSFHKDRKPRHLSCFYFGDGQTLDIDFPLQKRIGDTIENTWLILGKYNNSIKLFFFHPTPI